MKYLFLMFRHFFPKRVGPRWKIIGEVPVFERENAKRPVCIKYILQDQHGNLKNHEVRN